MTTCLKANPPVPRHFPPDVSRLPTFVPPVAISSVPEPIHQLNNSVLLFSPFKYHQVRKVVNVPRTIHSVQASVLPLYRQSPKRTTGKESAKCILVFFFVYIYFFVYFLIYGS